MSLVVFLFGMILAFGYLYLFKRNMPLAIVFMIVSTSCAMTNKFSLGGALAGICGIAIWSSVRYFIKNLQFRSWSIAKGQIISARVETQEKVFWGRSMLIFKPLIRYTYEYAGQQYFSEQVWDQERNYLERDKADRLVAKYPRGKSIQLCCNPHQPSQAFLESNIPVIIFVFFAIGLIGLISILLLVFGS